MGVSWTEFVSMANIQYVLFCISKDEIEWFLLLYLDLGNHQPPIWLLFLKEKTLILFEGVYRLSKHCVWKSQTITQV